MLQKPRFESEIINAFYEFLLKNGLKESTCNDYCRRILAICKQFHITPEELFEGRARYSIDDLIGIYTNHPEMKAENAKKHGAPLSALKKFKKFMEIRRSGHLQNKIVGERIYIKYAPIYQSFVIINKHISGFTIQDRHFELVYEQNERVCDIVEMQIDDKNYSDLIAVMRRYKNYLNDSKKSIWEIFPHGGVSAFEYRFEDKFSVYGGVWPLFVGGKPADDATIEFKRVIENIFRQSGGKSVPVFATPVGNPAPVPAASAPAAKHSAAGKADLSAGGFWEDFAEYLKEQRGLSEISVKYYLQYLRKSFETYLGMDMHAIQDRGEDERLSLVKQLHGALSRAIHTSADEKEKKRLRNYSSAVGALGDFLESLQSPVEEQEEEMREEVPVPPVSSEEVPAFCEDDVDDSYTYKELQSKFRSRLTTQDRNYDESCLPCRVLNDIYSDNPIYEDLLKRMFDRVVFLLANNQKVTLKDIVEVCFCKGLVWLKLKNGEVKLLYTEVYVKGKPMGYDKMPATMVSELTLDHDEALRKQLPKELENYPTLKKLSDYVVEFRKTFHSPNSKYKLAKAFFEQIYPCLGMDEEALLDELCAFYNKITFTIMFGKYNCSKNGRP